MEQKIYEEEIINKINSLKTDIDLEISNIGDAQQSVFEHLKNRSLESKKERLTDISKMLSIPKHRIVFIGTIGQGKTTAISHLFNLTGEFKRQEEINKKSRTITRTEPLFSTASGRTTICEVIIKAGNSTFIEIEPHSRETVETFINDFCDSLYETDANEGESLPTELERAIRSFINLKRTKINDKTVDLAKEAASKMEIEELKIEALKNANLDERIFQQENSKLFCPDDVDERTWLKENFDSINRGENKKFSIPNKMFVHVSPQILGDSDLSFFDSVVDTKGIDENPIRPDLREYIESEDTICLFTTRYNDAPETNVRELMKYFLTQKSKNYEYRFANFVMPHKGEPEKENDGDDTWDTGVEIKKDVVLDVFKKLNLNFLSENILFYDSLRFYDDRGRINPDYLEEDIQEAKNDIINRIKNLIINRKIALSREVEAIGESFLAIQNGKTLTDDDKEIIDDAVEKLKKLSDLKNRIPGFVFDEFIENYVDYYSNAYPAWNTKDAIHRNLGIYNVRNFDTYYDAKVVSEGLDEDSMLRKFTKEIKEEIIEAIENLGESHPDLKSLTPEIIKRFGISYDNFIDDVGTEIENSFRTYNNNYEFWSNLINRRGKGKGYNNDVITMLRRNLEMINTRFGCASANRILQDSTDKHWNTAINQVLNFFS
ncbi:MAG: hypothetical protein ACXVED_14635 [Bacteroidia bacterium]